MTKKIAVINDLSGFGRCSLTAAISVIAAMGVQPCPLPTAILSGQTGYPSYFYDDYTDKMDEFCREWKKMGASFDGIYTGFMSDVRQIEKVFDFLDTFYGKRTFLLVDPIMGDDGRRFGMCTPDFLSMMKELAAQADIITPNLTELCFLSGTEFRMIEQMTDEKHLLTIVEQMVRNVMDKGSGGHGDPFHRQFGRRAQDGESGGHQKRQVPFGFPVRGRELLRYGRSLRFCDGGRKSKGRQAG